MKQKLLKSMIKLLIQDNACYSKANFYG